MSHVFVGIDIAATTFTAAVWCEGQTHALGTFPNEATGLAQLTHALTTRGWLTEPTPLPLCLEPTGGYEHTLALLAYAQGWQVSRPNPKQVRDWAKGCGLRAKTDKLDARLLARYAGERRPPRWHPAAEEVDGLDSLLERRRDLEQMLQQERNRQQQLARRPRVAPPVSQNVSGLIASLQQALADIEAAIEAHLQQHPPLQQQARQLQSVPGVGAKNVLPLLVTLSRFFALTQGQGDPKALTAYVGLDPSTHESGTSVRGCRAISRQGNARLRQQLYMGALGGKRGNNRLRAFYERLVGRGKPKRVALIAAAHKILTWAWAVFRTHTDFDAAHLNQKVAAGS